jgi:hypothetical protein
LRYAEKVENYLKSTNAEKDKKRGKFQSEIDEIWDDAKVYSTKQMAKQIKNPSK